MHATNLFFSPLCVGLCRHGVVGEDNDCLLLHRNLHDRHELHRECLLDIMIVRFQLGRAASATCEVDELVQAGTRDNPRGVVEEPDYLFG